MTADECPACGKRASAQVEIEMGDNWRDTFGKPPHSLFSKYLMVHVGGQSRSGGLVIYCHTEADLQR